MKKKIAQGEMLKHANLLYKTFTHKKYHAKMRVVEIGVDETSPKSNKYYVFCKLEGKLGEVIETIEYVMKNYKADPVLRPAIL